MKGRNPTVIPQGIQPLAVSELIGHMKGLLEEQYADVWVEGEISNLSFPQSGHIYFTLKDATAHLKCVLYRGVALRMRFELGDGMKVFARGKISIYVPQGQYQLCIEECHPKGIGAVELALRQLKEKLLLRGYFDQARKRRLPAYPRSIALVTSPTGAAVRDMLELLAQRWPCARIIIFPVRVQGETASLEIAEALRTVNRVHAENSIVLEAVIVGRGGGSLEDLWAFNEEIVAHAIFQSRVPVISAVGHEIDVTIADLVADYRALTPSQAITALTPDRRDLMAGLLDLQRRLDDAMIHRIELARRSVNALAERRALRIPLERVRDQERRLDELGGRLRRAITHRLERSREQIAAVSGKLQSLSPLNVLARGYTLTRIEVTGSLVVDPASLAVGERLVTTLAQGEIVSRVEEVRKAPK